VFVLIYFKYPCKNQATAVFRSRLQCDSIFNKEQVICILTPKLSDLPTAIIVCAGQFSGGDKPHPYLFGETSFVAVGFIPAFLLK
jgi:hypothetical protein